MGMDRPQRYDFQDVEEVGSRHGKEFLSHSLGPIHFEFDFFFRLRHSVLLYQSVDSFLDFTPCKAYTSRCWETNDAQIHK